MNSRTIASAPPPFYWKVPVPEKDYMSENYRRIRHIANQAQKKRSEPLKAAFIPGVTKNEKYSHVPSKVGEFLKTRRGPEVNVEQNSANKPQRNVSRVSQPVSRRLSKSSVDLRGNQNQSIPNQNSAGQHMRNHVPPPAPVGRRRGSEESLHHHMESVYNWRFRDDVVQPAHVVGEFSGATLKNGYQTPSLPAKYCHRVEYLPCDGICAEENFVIDDAQQDSARSGSSCRTSRGCNTEETRILDDVVNPLLQPVKRVTSECSVMTDAHSNNPRSQMPKSKSAFTLPSQSQNIPHDRRNENPEWFQTNSKPSGSGDYNLESRLNALKVSNPQTTESSRVKASLSATSLKSGKHTQINGIGGGGDRPHTLGSVPKYLKQRQEEWRVQEKERKEAEMNANVPQGYALLSEEERIQHLQTFKRNYDSLINDLNRIPIRIDTIRVRDHKIQLEQQLTRLEEAMKTFSRPRVWVKMDD